MKTVLGLGLPHVRGAISVFGCWFPVQGCGFKAIWPKLIKIKYSKMERSLNMRETKIEPHFAQIVHFFHGFFPADLSKFSSLGIWRFNPPVLEPRLSDGGASPQIRQLSKTVSPLDLGPWSPGKKHRDFSGANKYLPWYEPRSVARETEISLPDCMRLHRLLAGSQHQSTQDVWFYFPWRIHGTIV